MSAPVEQVAAVLAEHIATGGDNWGGHDVGLWRRCKCDPDVHHSEAHVAAALLASDALAEVVRGEVEARVGATSLETPIEDCPANHGASCCRRADMCRAALDGGAQVGGDGGGA